MIRPGDVRSRPLLLVVATAVVGIIHGAHWPPMATGMIVVAVAGVFAPTLMIKPSVWASITIAWWLIVVVRWYSMEDHVYLFGAWLVALTAYLGDRDESRLSANARLLVCVVFAAAVGWKLAFGEYFNGSALASALIIDPRFTPLAEAIGIDASTLQPTRELLPQVLRGEVRSAAMAWSEDSWAWLRVVSTATIGIELLIALSFSHGIDRWRAVRVTSLCVFGLTTYVLVPVLGFAMVLALLGAAVEYPKRWPIIPYAAMAIIPWAVSRIL